MQNVKKKTLVNGKIYFAPADYHLLLKKDQTVSLDYSKKVNYSRLSIDITFKSLSEIYGQNLAAILLYEANSDGAEGLMYIREKMEQQLYKIVNKPRLKNVTTLH